MRKMYINRNNRNIYIRKGRNSRGRSGQGGSVIVMIIAVILLAAAGIYYIVNAVQKNNLYKEYMKAGSELYASKEYTQALEVFGNAVKIKPNDNKVKLEILNCHINTNTDNAIDYAREITKGNVSEDMLLQVVNAVNSVDPGSAYRLLENYASDRKSLGTEVQALIDSANSSPVMPELDMLQGTYVKLSSVKFKPSARFGNSIYYTFNVEDPNPYSKEYKGGFSVDKTTNIRARSFNPLGEGSDVAVFSFTVDTDMAHQLTSLIAEAKAASDGTKIGTAKGQCGKSNKDKLDKIIKEAENLMAQDNVLFMDAENYVVYVRNAIDQFENSLNTDVNKDMLSELSDYAAKIKAAISKSSVSNDLETQLNEMSQALDAAYKAYSSNITQDELNNVYYTLYTKLYDINNKGWKSAYEKTITENGMDYIIYDINFDDIPELIIQQENLTMFYGYSVSEGKSVNAVVPSNTKYDIFFESKEGLLCCKGSYETGEFRLITYKDNKISLSDPIDEYVTNQTLRTSLKEIKFNKPGNYKNE